LAIKAVTLQALRLNGLPRRGFSRPSSDEQLAAGLWGGRQPSDAFGSDFLVEGEGGSHTAFTFFMAAAWR